MNDKVIDRLCLCIRAEGTEFKDLADKIGVSRARLSKTLKGQLRLSHKEFLDLTDQYPEYKYWIIFGEEIPEMGYISPTTKLSGNN